MKRLSLLSMILLAVLAPLACSKTFTLAPLSLTPTPNVTFTPTSTPTVTATLTPIGTPTWTPSPTYTPTPPVFDFAFGTAGNGNGQFNSSIQGPTGIAVDSSGMIYVTDYGNRRVEKFNPSGTYLTQWTGYTWPWGIAVDPVSGNIYVADLGAAQVVETTNTGTVVTSWGTSGTGGGTQFGGIWGIAVDSNENVYTSDNTQNRIQKFTSSGTYETEWGSTGAMGNGQFDEPTEIGVDSLNQLYVPEITCCDYVQVFNSSGVLSNQWTLFPDSGYGVAVTHAGNVYVVDKWNNCVYHYNTSGSQYYSWGSAGTGNYQFNYPYAVAVDSAGAIYVADTGNERIMKFGP